MLDANSRKKTYLAFAFTKRCLFWQFIEGKVMVLVSMYYLLAGDTSAVSNVSLHKIKVSKQHRFIL